MLKQFATSLIRRYFKSSSIFIVFFICSCVTCSCVTQENKSPVAEFKEAELRDQIESLEDTIEELNSKIAQLRKGQSPSKKTNASKKIMTGKWRNPQKPVEDEVDEQTIADSSQENMVWYYTGLDRMKSKEYEKAIRAFQEFLQTSPNHVYADRAQYLIAEAYLKSEQYPLALTATEAFESRYPYSFRLSDVYLSRAISFQKLGEEVKSKNLITELKKRFPDSEAEKAAQDLFPTSIAMP